MAHECDEIGWGLAPWGIGPWGGDAASPGGPLPIDTEEGFDIFCFGPCGPLEFIFTHPEVTQGGQASQFVADPITSDYVIGSGGPYPTDDARITIDVPVPQAFTHEVTINFRRLPNNFGDLTNKHVFIGAFDAQGNSVGLFVSKIGLIYTGAVHHDGGGNLVIDSPTQQLPDSQLLVQEDVYYTIRLVTSYDNGTTYIYWTKREDVHTIGHQLRYVLPGIVSQNALQVPPDSTLLSIRGTAGEPSVVYLDTLCLGTGLLIPNLPPRADAGLDQAVRTCAIVLLDGSKSFDPEGSLLTYKWRLLDAPLGSEFIFDGFDALTYPLLVPTGFTNKIHSAELATEHASDPLDAGDVIVVDGDPYNIVTTGIDGNGFYVEIDGFDIVDSHATGQAFKVLRQRGISGPTTVKPTFLPDKPGLYKFDLIVYDGQLYSFPSVTIVNVTASPVARGVIPDCRFLWGYLSDFWRLVEDKERIEVFWSGMAQIAAAELLNLWQIEYSKSLRDVPRTFQRRWLRYDLLIEEDPLRLEETELRAIFGGVDSSNLTIAGVASAVLDLEIGDTTHQVTIATPAQGTVSDVATKLATDLQLQLRLIDERFTVDTIISQDSSIARVKMNAPFVFKVKNTSTLTIFPFVSNSYPTGAGLTLGDRTYGLDRSVGALDIQEGDFLVLGDTAYRIARVVTEASDTFPSQRITTLDPLPISAPPTWSISGQATSKTLNFWDALVCKDDVVFLDVVRPADGAIARIRTTVLGASSEDHNTLALDLSPVGAFLADDENFSVYLHAVLRRKYLPVDALVVDVPYLQEHIVETDDKQVLRRNVDYFLETFRSQPCLRFVVGSPDIWQSVDPPFRMWAETTYLDNRPMVEENFGIPAGFTLDQYEQLTANVDYLSAVRGLWFAYFNGPTLFNMRAGVQILLGLPFAEEAGTIEEIRDDFSSTQGRILIRDSKNTELVRSYTFPATLDVETNPDTGKDYVVGDTVAQFAPLVKGTEVIDWIKDPKWIEGYILQGAKFEVDKFFQFIVRVDSLAFNLNALLFAQSFVRRIKPTYTFPIFIVRSRIGEAEVSVSDTVKFVGTLTMFMGSVFGSDGQAMMWDQARPSYGGYWNQYDVGNPNGPAPTFPNANQPLDWAYDQYLLSPNEVLLAALRTTFGAPTLPTADSIFYADMPVFTDKIAAFQEGPFFWLPPSPGKKIGSTVTSAVTDTINKIVFFYRGVGDGTLLTLVVKKNGGTAATHTFTQPTSTGVESLQYKASMTVSIPVVPGDTLEAFIYHPTGFNTYVESTGLVLGVGTDWLADTPLAADTYSTYVVL